MDRILLLFGLLVVLLCNTASADVPRETNEVMVWGVGHTSCGQFTKVMTENPQNDIPFGQWLFGYLTALNSTHRSIVDHAGGIDLPGLLSWLTEYCKANPLNSFYDATNALVQQLEKDGRIRKKKKAKE